MLIGSRTREIEKARPDLEYFAADGTIAACLNFRRQQPYWLPGPCWLEPSRHSRPRQRTLLNPRQQPSQKLQPPRLRRSLLRQRWEQSSARNQLTSIPHWQRKGSKMHSAQERRGLLNRRRRRSWYKCKLKSE